ncbi:MAG TPA: isoprenylcysteine carboxylmethyltransferase family protein [Ktedonobacterales bacterium]
MVVSDVAMPALFSLPGNFAANWQKWILFGVFAVFGAAIFLSMLTRPALLLRRLRGGPLYERTTSQRVIVLALYVALIALFVVTGLDARFGWSSAPLAVMLIGDALVAAGLLLVLLVFRANEFAGSSVRVEAGQSVISTGLYARIRHPMYSGLLLLFLGAPLAVGSLWGLAVFPALLAVIIWRLTDEEKYLVAHLPGYQEYRERVTRRLVPGVW